MRDCDAARDHPLRAVRAQCGSCRSCIADPGGARIPSPGFTAMPPVAADCVHLTCQKQGGPASFASATASLTWKIALHRREGRWLAARHGPGVVCGIGNALKGDMS